MAKKNVGGHYLDTGLDSIAVSIFKDILVELTNTEYQYQYQTPKSKKNFC